MARGRVAVQNGGKGQSRWVSYGLPVCVKQYQRPTTALGETLGLLSAEVRAATATYLGAVTVFRVAPESVQSPPMPRCLADNTCVVLALTAPCLPPVYIR